MRRCNRLSLVPCAARGGASRRVSLQSGLSAFSRQRFSREKHEFPAQRREYGGASTLVRPPGTGGEAPNPLAVSPLEMLALPLLRFPGNISYLTPKVVAQPASGESPDSTKGDGAGDDLRGANGALTRESGEESSGARNAVDFLDTPPEVPEVFEEDYGEQRLREHFLSSPLVGFDSEAKPAVFGKRNRTAIVQLSTDKVCAVWRVSGLRTLPPLLAEVLASEKIAKACQGALLERETLEDEFFRPELRNFVDLFEIAKVLNTSPRSLQGLVAIFCRARLRKEQRCSNWEQDPLSKAQLEYIGNLSGSFFFGVSWQTVVLVVLSFCFRA